MGTPIWPIEGVELNSTGEMVADSLGDVLLDQTAEISGIATEVDKIDSAAVDGLSGTVDSVGYIISELYYHVHNLERWWGSNGAATETNAIAATVTAPFVATSGNNTWGAAIPILGTGDTPVPSGDTIFDVHRLLVTDLDDETDPWRIRIIYGTSTSAAAISAGQWSEVMVESNAVPGNRAGAQPIDIMMPRLAVGTKLWTQVWNNTNAETLSFFYGVHGYVA